MGRIPPHLSFLRVLGSGPHPPLARRLLKRRVCREQITNAMRFHPCHTWLVIVIVSGARCKCSVDICSSASWGAIKVPDERERENQRASPDECRSPSGLRSSLRMRPFMKCSPYRTIHQSPSGEFISLRRSCLSVSECFVFS